MTTDILGRQQTHALTHLTHHRPDWTQINKQLLLSHCDHV